MSDINHLSDPATDSDGQLFIARCDVDVHAPKEDQKLKQFSVTWDRLGSVLTTPKVGPKEGSHIIAGKVKADKRGKDETELIDMIFIDGDSSVDPETGEITDGAPPIENAIAAMDEIGINYSICHSHSFDPSINYNRWRIGIPGRVRSKAELAACVAFLVEQLNARGCHCDNVSENKDFGRAWYLPRCKAENLDIATKNARFYKDRKPFDVAAALKWSADKAAAEEAIERRKHTATPEAPKLENYQSSIIKDFNKAADLDWVRRKLESHGYKFHGKEGDDYRYIAPQSTTKTAGVVVFIGEKGDWCVYSWHGAHDPLSRKFCDPFRLLAVLDYGDDLKATAQALKPTPLEYDAAKAMPVDFGTPKQKSEKSGINLIPFRAFKDGLAPPDYVLDGIMQRGWLYSFTSITGHGKTAVALCISSSVARGESLSGREVQQGNVVYFAGENADDVRARCIMLADHVGTENLPIHFIDHIFKIGENLEGVHAAIGSIGGATLIVVDTAAAFFEGDDDNANVVMGDFARLLRQLTKAPGNPAVLVLAHPTKNASKHNLLPRGGGAFLNEVDGNFTLWSEGDGISEMHWQGKLRGNPAWEALSFRLKECKSPRHLDSKGREMPSVLAFPLNHAQAGQIKEEQFELEDRVLISILDNPGLSIRNRARLLGVVTDAGLPNAGRMNRVLEKLIAEKFVTKSRKGVCALTYRGEAEVKELRGMRHWEKLDPLPEAETSATEKKKTSAKARKMKPENDA